MQGKLKSVQFFVEDRRPIDIQQGEIVEITATENHHIFGKRYKILGCNEWLEENCFEYINQ